MVTKVKADREVGLAYMKSLEIERRIREEGREEGRAEGMAEGEAEAVLALLGTKGTVLPEVERAIRVQTDTDVLMKWLLLAARVEDAEGFQKQAGILSIKQ